MPQPPALVPPYDFSSDLGTQHGVRLDASFDAVKDVTDAISGNLGLIQRDDGELRNQTVTLDALSSSVLALIASEGLSFRGVWVTATSYAVNDLVSSSTTTYVCLVAHTSGTFNTDLAAAKWMVFSQVTSTPAASGVSFSATGGIASTNVQTALAELDTEKAAAAGSSAQAFAVAAASTPEGAARLSQVQGEVVSFAVGANTGNAITATITAAGVSAFADGMLFRIRAPGANSSATPTLNLTVGAVSSGALIIVRGPTGGALSVGDIAGTSHELLLQYKAGSPNQWVLLNPALISNVVVTLPAGIGPLPFSGSNLPEGRWLWCDGAEIAIASYPALYAVLGTTWGALTNGSGVAGSTHFRLPSANGRTAIGDGTGSVSESFTNAAITTGTDAITVASNAKKWITGMLVTFTTNGGTAPTTSAASQLDNNDTVYIVRIDSTTIKFASSLANAQNGTVIDITAAGSGTFTITHTLATRTLGELLGEENHAMSSSELLAHTHTDNYMTSTTGYFSGGTNQGYNIGPAGTTTTGSTGSNNAMNVMQPSLVTKMIISY